MSCCEPWHPEFVRRLSLVAALALACTEAPEVDPLDPELIRELAAERGSASGDDHGGTWTFEFEFDTCDCPSVDILGETQDLCELVPFTPTELQVTHSGGRLAISMGAITATGAIESDGTFVVAASHDASTIVGPLDALARLDGTFEQDGKRAQGWAGQRLIGQFAGEPLDCRRTGSFVAQRL